MKLPLLLFFICLHSSIFSQKDTLTTEAIWPLGLSIHEDMLYIAEADNNQISRLDLSDDNSDPIPFIIELDEPFYLEIHEGILYYTEHDLGTLHSVDLSEPAPISETLLSGLDYPKSVLVHDSFLYFSEFGKISRINLNEENPAIEIIRNDLISFINLASDGESLYFLDYGSDKISKINFDSIFSNPEEILTQLNNPLSGMTIIEDLLFYFEYGSTEISYINIASENSTPTVFENQVVSGDIIAHGNYLYVSDFMNDLILRYNTRGFNIISNNDELIDQEILLFPNPAHNIIYLTESRDLSNYKLVNATGTLIEVNPEPNVQQINIEHLVPGIYFLISEDGKKFKFTKL